LVNAAFSQPAKKAFKIPGEELSWVKEGELGACTIKLFTAVLLVV
jgi:hypothetical protein